MTTAVLNDLLIVRRVWVRADAFWVPQLATRDCLLSKKKKKKRLKKPKKRKNVNFGKSKPEIKFSEKPRRGTRSVQSAQLGGPSTNAIASTSVGRVLLPLRWCKHWANKDGGDRATAQSCDVLVGFSFHQILLRIKPNGLHVNKRWPQRKASHG
jgi:hypothetical protein